MKPTYLYVKTHDKTGLKYFGKTVKDPYSYKGSGTVWLRHLKKYGDAVSTVVLNNGEPYTDPSLLRIAATDFSNAHSIVESKEWANLMVEDGFTGGSIISGYSPEEYQILCNRNKEVANRPEVKAKKSQVSKEVHNRPEVRLKKSINGKIAQNNPEHKEKHRLIMKEVMAEANKIKLECVHCHKFVTRHMFGRWHGDQCKQKV